MKYLHVFSKVSLRMREIKNQHPVIPAPQEDMSLNVTISGQMFEGNRMSAYVHMFPSSTRRVVGYQGKNSSLAVEKPGHTILSKRPGLPSPAIGTWTVCTLTACAERTPTSLLWYSCLNAQFESQEKTSDKPQLKDICNVTNEDP